MKNWEHKSRIGTPAKPWHFFRSVDDDLKALMDNQGRWGYQDDEITDRLVAKALFRERWKYRFRVGGLVWRAAKRRVLIWYGVARDAVVQKFENIAKREETKQAEETPSTPVVRDALL